MPSALFDIPREQDYYGIFSATTIAGMPRVKIYALTFDNTCPAATQADRV